MKEFSPGEFKSQFGYITFIEMDYKIIPVAIPVNHFKDKPAQESVLSLLSLFSLSLGDDTK